MPGSIENGIARETRFAESLNISVTIVGCCCCWCVVVVVVAVAVAVAVVAVAEQPLPLAPQLRRLLLGKRTSGKLTVNTRGKAIRVLAISSNN